MTLRSYVFCGAISSCLALASCSSSSSPSTTAGPLKPIQIIDLNISDTSQWISTLDLDQDTVTSKIIGTSPDRNQDGKIIYKNTNNDLVESTQLGYNTTLIVKQNMSTPFDQLYDDNFTNPRLSPDRKYVAYEGVNGNFYVVPRAGGQPVAKWESTGGKPTGYHSPSWTTSGKILVAGDPDLNPGLWLLDINNPAPTAVGTGLVKPMYPNASSDGRVCFVMNGYIYVMSLTDLKPTRLTDSTWINTSRFPTWSPDGKWIAAFANESFLLIPTVTGAAIVDAKKYFHAPGVVFDNTINQISWR